MESCNEWPLGFQVEKMTEYFEKSEGKCRFQTKDHEFNTGHLGAPIVKEIIIGHRNSI